MTKNEMKDIPTLVWAIMQGVAAGLIIYSALKYVIIN